MTYEKTTSPEDINVLRIERAQAELEAFADNPALIEIFAGEGCAIEPVDPAQSAADQGVARRNRLAVMQAHAEKHWDARKGIAKERQEVEWGTRRAEESKYYDQFIALGLVESSLPAPGNKDFLVILGGSNDAPLLRLRYGLEQAGSEGYLVGYDGIALLGAGRKVTDKERPKTELYAPGARTEHDLMDGAVHAQLDDALVDKQPLDFEARRGFGLDNPDYWKVHYFETRDGQSIFSLHSDYALDPSKPKKSRANSRDTFAFFRATAGDMLGPNTEMDVVTHAMFTRDQHFDAVREITLTTGARVQTFGFEAAYGGVTRMESQILQELKSTVNAAIRLQDAIQEASGALRA